MQQQSPFKGSNWEKLKQLNVCCSVLTTGLYAVKEIQEFNNGRSNKN